MLYLLVRQIWVNLVKLPFFLMHMSFQSKNLGHIWNLITAHQRSGKSNVFSDVCLSVILSTGRCSCVGPWSQPSSVQGPDPCPPCTGSQSPIYRAGHLDWNVCLFSEEFIFKRSATVTRNWYLVVYQKTSLTHMRFSLHWGVSRSENIFHSFHFCQLFLSTISCLQWNCLNFCNYILITLIAFNFPN